ncbi:SCO3933 family regulatory protein [Streptomyces sp. NBC_01803]|uniref:SCO3933 family regulatory protein n=1 Tax=Streptomyces sp. NBC_01803 TaxID=2975946 RepID=UPI002DDAD3F2|nr:hypothetical protein [Streptomyces sp. NBC_01803]WSA45105.1 hypothetical protein OIE51_13350 [Streptomyces sp. NBC_01803]
MAMHPIQKDISQSTFLLVTPAAPKIKDPQTGEVATHRDTGETLYTVGVVEMLDGRADVLKITIPQSGLAEGLAQSAAVRPVRLVALPWARIFNGQLSDGVAYRADALEAAL